MDMESAILLNAGQFLLQGRTGTNAELSICIHLFLILLGRRLITFSGYSAFTFKELHIQIKDGYIMMSLLGFGSLIMPTLRNFFSLQRVLREFFAVNLHIMMLDAFLPVFP